MAARALRFVPAMLLLLFCSTVSSQNFPDMKDIEFAFYQTEVEIVDVYEQISAYATEYYSAIEEIGALKLYFQGDQQVVYYSNTSILDISGFNCTAWDVDISEFDYKPIYYGWLNKEPIIVGPSAAFWYAQTRKKDIKKAAKQEDVRSIKCDKWTLPVKNDKDDLIYEYYFAKSDWTTPYKYENLRVPIRLRIYGNSSRYAADGKTARVEQINDFAYFKQEIDDMSNLMPPIGLGCKEMEETDYMPDVPKAFMYSAEVVDLLGAKEHADVEIQFQKTWYDHERLIARRDGYTRKKGYRSILYDFNTGTLYRIVEGGACEMAILRDTDFQKIDRAMTSIMKSPKEALNLDGEFYDMGTRTIRGLTCDTFESVQFDKHFKGKRYYKLVVTAYFTQKKTKVGIGGEMESRIPIYYIITGYETPNNKTLQLQYNIFAFDDVVWPQMYTSFRLDRCYTKSDSKVYFVMVLPLGSADAAKMEEQDDLIITRLRSAIAVNARVPEMRIPYLQADYKPSGVYVTGLMLERPPALLQFYDVDTGPTTTNDRFLKVSPQAETTEECAYACVDERDFTCKGFYFCGRACFLKSTDPFDNDDPGKSKDLGECTEYIRDEIESTNFRQSYLVDAMGYLDQSVLDGNVSIAFQIKDGEEVVTVADLIVGDGPYIGDDTADKPFSINVEWRKLDSSLQTVNVMEYVGSLHDCYKRCKEEGSECSSFSYCPDSKNDNKECMISSELVVKGLTKDTDLIADKNCNIYNLKYADYFIPFPEKVSFLDGDRVIRGVEAVDKCAASCRMEKNFTCRGFEYCKARKVCTLHKKHILDMKPGESGTPKTKECVHYGARYIMDYQDLGGVLVDDNGNVRYGTNLEECARICSEDLKTDCKSFNYCHRDDSKGTDTTCELSKKLLRDKGVTTSERTGCMHYEKRDAVHDWDNSKADTLGSGYTKKGFAGLVVGMIALGIVVGALGFVFYSYMRAKRSGEGMAVRFMKNDS